MKITALIVLVGVGVSGQAVGETSETVGTSERLPYNHPGLIVDLGVGLWAQPLPMDYDNDGDFDLLVATADVPSNGIYFFENPGGDVKYPLFKAGVRVERGAANITVSYVNEQPTVMTPGKQYPAFKNNGLKRREKVLFKQDFHAGRTNQWKYCDYDGDENIDLIIGVSDWRDYGWDNAFDEKGLWTNGPLHGYVYFVRNTGTNANPVYAPSIQLHAGGQPLDVYGAPSPNFADWDSDGDLDLICGEFMDKITYFENVGTRTEPHYAPGRYLTFAGEPITMDLQMLQVVAVDWDRDGDVDLVVGQEDGRVALIENTGELLRAEAPKSEIPGTIPDSAADPNSSYTSMSPGIPAFLPPRFFQQEADCLKIGALCTPFSIDWDSDGDEDLIAGDTAGYLNFIENLDGGDPPCWAAPAYLQADGEVIRIQAGSNGSIQGPCEAKWGYTVLNVADWNHDGLPDIVINSIWGEILWYENVGTQTNPKLKAAQHIEVQWDGPNRIPAWNWWTPKGKELVTQWRTTPMVLDLNQSGLSDLVMLDHEGYLAFFERRKIGGEVQLLPGKRVFRDEAGQPLRLNEREAGKSGRRKLAFADWDGDGRRDLLLNARSIDWMRNLGEANGYYTFEAPVTLDARHLAGHTTCPTVVDWDRDGIPGLLTGAEDGFLYYLKNPRTTAEDKRE